MMKKLNETPLFNTSNECICSRVDIYDVERYILSLNSDLNVEITDEDYDDHGSELYLEIKGVTANIKIEVESTSDFWCLHCRIEPTTNEFELKNNKLRKIISKNYQENIKDLLDTHTRYLTEDNHDLFKKVTFDWADYYPDE